MNNNTTLENDIEMIYEQFQLTYIKKHDLEELAARFGAAYYSVAPQNMMIDDVIFIKKDQQMK